MSDSVIPAGFLDTLPRPLGLFGVGNPIAGDDGAGIYIVEKLRQKLGRFRDMVFHHFCGDLFEIDTLLDTVAYIIFCDALVDKTAGHIRRFHPSGKVPSPSLHHTGIAEVMHLLRPLHDPASFPDWEICAVTVTIPFTAGEHLTPAVKTAADRMVSQLCTGIHP